MKHTADQQIFSGAPIHSAIIRNSEKRFSDAESLSNALEVVVARNRHLELLLQQKDAEAKQREGFILMLQTTSKQREQECLTYIASLRNQLVSVRCAPCEDYLPSWMTQLKKSQDRCSLQQQTQQHQQQQPQQQQALSGVGLDQKNIMKKKRLDRHQSEVTLNGYDQSKMMHSNSSLMLNQKASTNTAVATATPHDHPKSLTPNKAHRHTRTSTQHQKEITVAAQPTHEVDSVTYRKRIEDLLSTQSIGKPQQSSQQQQQSQQPSTSIRMQHQQKIGSSIFEAKQQLQNTSSVLPRAPSPTAFASTNVAMITLRAQQSSHKINLPTDESSKENNSSAQQHQGKELIDPSLNRGVLQLRADSNIASTVIDSKQTQQTNQTKTLLQPSVRKISQMEENSSNSSFLTGATSKKPQEHNKNNLLAQSSSREENRSVTQIKSPTASNATSFFSNNTPINSNQQPSMPQAWTQSHYQQFNSMTGGFVEPPFFGTAGEVSSPLKGGGTQYQAHSTSMVRSHSSEKNPLQTHLNHQASSGNNAGESNSKQQHSSMVRPPVHSKSGYLDISSNSSSTKPTHATVTPTLNRPRETFFSNQTATTPLLPRKNSTVSLKQSVHQRQVSSNAIPPTSTAAAAAATAGSTPHSSDNSLIARSHRNHTSDKSSNNLSGIFPPTVVSVTPRQQTNDQFDTLPQTTKQCDEEPHESSENAMFQNNNYNFSSIIKTIATNTPLVGLHTACRGKSISSHQSSTPSCATYHSVASVQEQPQVRGSVKELNKMMQISQKLPEGDHENEYTLHDSFVSDSSSATLCVNNERSIINPTFADEENTNNSNNNGEFDQLFMQKNILKQNGFRDSHQLLTKYSNINLKIKDFSSKKSALFSKQPHSLADSTKEYIPTKIFEEFFITGPSPADIAKAVAPGNSGVPPAGTIVGVNPKVLFHYSPQDASRSQKSIIHEFTFPFGCSVKQLRMTNSFSSINEILYANTTNQHSSSVETFVLAFNETNNASSLGNSSNSTNPSSSFPIFHSKALALLERVNPSRQTYCICFRVKDFVESTKSRTNTTNSGLNDGTPSLQKSYSTSNISKTKMKFWKTEKVFCFVTYFPFVAFFAKVISHMLNLVKLKRIKTYNERLDSIPNTLSNIDSDFFLNTFTQLADKGLSELFSMDLPEIGSVLEASIQNERISYHLPIGIEASSVENEWGIADAVVQFDLTNLVFLFLCMLYEQSIVFTSKNISLLTSTLLLFQNSLIKPLKWMNPMVFNLPEKLIPLLGSPVPIMVGINKDISFIQKSHFDVEFSTCVFVQLGNNSVRLINAANVDTIPLDLFNELKQLVEPSLTRLQQAHSTQMPQDYNINDSALAVINILSGYVRNEILAKIPKVPIYQKKQPCLLDYDAIASATIANASIKHHTFINALFKTQMIAQYLEDKYKSIPHTILSLNP